jgi:UDP-glucoronosyl and UDP-glucosyl transferase
MLRILKVVNLKKEKFDLVIVPIFMNDCALPFARHNGAPLILIGPAAGTMHFDLGVGSPEPTSYVPNLFLPFTDRMNFAERLINTLIVWLLNFIKYVVSMFGILVVLTLSVF